MRCGSFAAAVAAAFALLLTGASAAGASEIPRGTYRLAEPTTKPSVVTEFTVTEDGEWLSVVARKQSGGVFQFWVEHPQQPRRYIFREGSAAPTQYRHAVTGMAVLPSAVPFADLLPQAVDPATATYLGHRYKREGDPSGSAPLPGGIRTVELHPDLMIGPNSNARPRDNFRRWDGSDYAMVRFTREDYRTLADAGVTCVQVDDQQSAWAGELGLYYWGGGAQLPFPEMLYRSQYLGPALYLDEPAVTTRDHTLRPRLASDEKFRLSIRPRDAFAAFQAHYDETLANGAPARLRKLLAAGPDIDLGSMTLVQHNLYSWETMIDAAAFELTRNPQMPQAFVYEPAGRVGSRRTLPELNMTMGTQFATGDVMAFTELIYAFLRGAARAAGKDWGVSVYGAVDRTDAPFWLTRAYDLGATRFHFWDNYQLAAVPVAEYLALTRHLRNHAASHPRRDLNRLRRAAEVAITLPPGYGIGHTHFGRGNLWGLPELNLERRNDSGIPYRTVMSNFFLEAERLIRQGIAFDALWELRGVALSGYREVVRIREDGRVAAGKQILTHPRRADPKPGDAPRLTVEIQGDTAIATVSETTAPVYYTHGTDREGRYPNAMVLWELYGPGDADYRMLVPENPSGPELKVPLPLDKPGAYRLRAATVDTAGRSTVVWRTIERSASRTQ